MRTMKFGKQIILTVGGIIIFLFAVIAFVFIPGAGGFGRNSGLISLGTWDGIRIENTPDGLFAKQYAMISRAAEQYGLYPNDPAQREMIDYQIMHIAFQAAVIELASMQTTQKSGFVLTSDMLNKHLIPFYSDSNGIYSPQIYQNTSEQVKLARRKEVSDAIYSSQYFQNLFSNGNDFSGLKMSENEVKFIKDMTKDERSFQYIVITDKVFPAENIVKYGKEHKDLFAVHHLSMLTYATQEEAKKVLDLLNKKETSFEDAVATGSTKTGTDSAGKMTHSYRSDVNAMFPETTDLNAVLNLQPQELSAVVKTGSGFAIVRCDALPTEPDFASEEMRTHVFNYLLNNERGIVEDYIADEAKRFVDEAKKESGFGAAAKKANLNVLTSKSFSINYGNVSVLPQLPRQSDPAFSGIERNENFFKTAFSLKEGQISDPILLGNQVVVLKLHEKKISDESVLNTTADSYKQAVNAWYDQFPIFMLGFMQLPWGQQTCIDYILNSPKFKDTFSNMYRR
ncbi:hypothetical protein HMPREF9554_02614 [Treponema phagedenis F0421]|nr:hypothetical protein HMPREF9554_02614 [Treponema phagedenis F0421]